MIYVVREKLLEIYITSNGKMPFSEWLESVDSEVRNRIQERLYI